jgi:AraC-like DNA-binding protein
MKFLEFPPCPVLRNYINCYWYLEGRLPANNAERIFPDGCLEILINLSHPAERITLSGEKRTNPQVELIGQATRHYFIQSKTELEIVGIRFFPHTASVFLKQPVTDFNNDVVPLTLLNNTWKELSDKALDKGSLSEIVTLFDQYFVRLLPSLPVPKFDYVTWAVAEIIRSANTQRSTNWIAKKLGITERYLEQLFNTYVGLSPKMLSKIIRFQNAFRYLQNKNLSLTEVAHCSGYFDQSHFIRNFKTFTGITPSQYRFEQPRISAPFLSETSSSYLYNSRF